jgi:acyl dehydratase
MADLEQWVDPHAGFEYRPDTVTVEAAYQAEKLGHCGLDPAIFGNTVDASFYIGLAIRAGVASGISAEGNVNMLQSLVQHRPAGLGERLNVRGVIAAVTDVPRGRVVDTDVWFEDDGGERVITARRRSLKPDPGKAGRGAGDRPPPVLERPDEARRLAHHTLTPARVIGYSEAGNSIHYDPEAARKAGFRAPLIGGGMGVHYLLAAVYADGAPERLDLDIYFRRPIFWDDAFDVVVDESGTAMALTRTDAGTTKVLTEMRINERA